MLLKEQCTEIKNDLTLASTQDFCFRTKNTTVKFTSALYLERTASTYEGMLSDEGLRRVKLFIYRSYLLFLQRTNI